MTQAVQWDQGISDAWSRIAQTGPKVLVFALIVVIGALVVRALIRVVDRALVNSGFDRLLARSGVGRLFRCHEVVVRDALIRFAAAVCMLAVVRVALGVFGPSPADRMTGSALGVLARVLLALAIGLAGLTLAAAARQFVTDSFAGLRHGRALSRAAGGIAVLVFGKAALDELGIGTSVTTPLLYAVLAAGTGVVVVGVGGGLIRPMQSRWEEILDQAEDTAAEARAAWRANHEPTAPPTGTRAGIPVSPGIPPARPVEPPARPVEPPARPVEPRRQPVEPRRQPVQARRQPTSPPFTAAAPPTAPPWPPSPQPAQRPSAAGPTRPAGPATPANPPAPRRPPMPPPGEQRVRDPDPRTGARATRPAAAPPGPVASTEQIVPPPPMGTSPRSQPPAPPPTSPVRGEQAAP